MRVEPMLRTWDDAMRRALEKRCPAGDWEDISSLSDARMECSRLLDEELIVHDDLFSAVQEAHPSDASAYFSDVRKFFTTTPVMAQQFHDATITSDRDNEDFEEKAADRELDRISRRPIEHAKRGHSVPPYDDGSEPSDDEVADELEQISKRANEAAIKRAKQFSGTESQTRKVMSAIARYGDGVHVKATSESLSSERSKQTWPDGSPRLNHKGQQIYSMSECDWAKMGVLMKMSLRKLEGMPEITDWDRSLYQEMIDKETWIKPIGVNGEEFIKGHAVKTVLQELLGSTSDAIVPEFFDTRVIELMLLRGEIFPYCNIVDVPAGSVIETGQIGNVTGTWDQLDGADQTIFDPTSLLTPITATVKSFSCLVEVGNELLSDTPVQLGMLLAGRMINKASAELDRVVLSGAAADEPEGVMNASNTIDIPSQNGAGGPLTDTDHVNLTFGIPKVLEREARYAMKRATYKRFRSIVTGVTGDDRRLYQGGLKSYQIDDVPVSVVEPAPSTGRGQGGLTDREIVFANFSKYRVWRRLGMTLRSDSTGYTNVRRNQTLFSLRMRLAGKVIDADAFAIMDDADAGT